MTTISVNGERWDRLFNVISYEEVVALAGLTGNPTMVYKAARNGDVQRAGSMCAGTRVKNIDGLRFTVCHTGNA